MNNPAINAIAKSQSKVRLGARLSAAACQNKIDNNYKVITGSHGSRVSILFVCRLMTKQNVVKKPARDSRNPKRSPPKTLEALYTNKKKASNIERWLKNSNTNNINYLAPRSIAMIMQR
jgi:hypothetical protein